MFRTIRRLACVALLGVVALGLAGSAQAGGYGGYGYGGGYGYYLKPVISYNYIQEPYTKAITIYDDYGCPQVIYKTYYKTVAVPVTTYVKVAYGYGY